MKKIVILYGGRSGEHEVSLISAANVLRNLDRKRFKATLVGIDKSGAWFLQDQPKAQPDASMASLPPVKEGVRVLVAPAGGLCVEGKDGRLGPLDCDVVFPVLHGTYGEDGTVQGLLECAGLPYVGSGVLGSAIGMDKQVAKELFLREGIPVADSIWAIAADRKDPSFIEHLTRKIEARFGWPCFVKPACSGSSVGTTKVHSPEELLSAIELAFAYDEKVLVEEFVQAREIECAVLGNEAPTVFAPGEVIPSHEYYDYDAKYLDPEGASFVIPAAVTEEQAQAIRSYAAKAYRLCGLSGMARVDFFVDKLTGKVLLNEVNTIPGFTGISMYPAMAAAGGTAVPKLVEALVELAVARHKARGALRTSYGDKAD